eukprot:2088719-Amphidinium_carterae.1
MHWEHQQSPQVSIGLPGRTVRSADVGWQGPQPFTCVPILQSEQQNCGLTVPLNPMQHRFPSKPFQPSAIT